ncbi:hypothetical protein ABIB62_003755 [Mucilaginibacter sp. UYP25]|uniref:SIR2 family protein n=1 Tax=unclassified Mucilaginibacter TaxID=2617802 RepID=UPI0033985651
MVSFFIGAGFSKWSADLPLVHQLFDFNISEIRSGDRKWHDKLYSEKETWQRSHPNENNEAFISHIISDKGPRLNNYLSKYIARRLSEPFLCSTLGSIQTFMFDDKKIKSLDSIKKAKSFFGLYEMMEIGGIITTNYDLVLEYAFGTSGFRYGRRSQKVLGRGHNPLFPYQHTPVNLTGNILISKIHGSISFDGANYWSSGICGLNGNALIVPPSIEKNLNIAVQAEWENAANVLSRSNELIVFGFNFKPYDIAVLDLLKHNSGNVKKVTIYDIESKFEKARQIWTSAEIIEIHIQNMTIV